MIKIVHSILVEFVENYPWVWFTMFFIGLIWPIVNIMQFPFPETRSQVNKLIMRKVPRAMFSALPSGLIMGLMFLMGSKSVNDLLIPVIWMIIWSILWGIGYGTAIQAASSRMYKEK